MESFIEYISNAQSDNEKRALSKKCSYHYFLSFPKMLQFQL